MMHVAWRRVPRQATSNPSWLILMYNAYKRLHTLPRKNLGSTRQASRTRNQELMHFVMTEMIAVVIAIVMVEHAIVGGADLRLVRLVYEGARDVAVNAGVIAGNDITDEISPASPIISKDAGNVTPDNSSAATPGEVRQSVSVAANDDVPAFRVPSIGLTSRTKPRFRGRRDKAARRK
jgi:hypothetical protein